VKYVTYQIRNPNAPTRASWEAVRPGGVD